MELKKIIEMPLRDLEPYLATGPISRERIYGEIIVAYLLDNPESLQIKINDFYRITVENDDLRIACKLRLAIRTQEKNLDLRAIQNHLSQIAPSVEKGEIAFLLGMYLNVMENWEESLSAYAAAYTFLSEIDCQKKAAKSYVNMVVADSRQNPSSKLFIKYRQALKICQNAKEWGMAGIALLNIAREHSILGAFDTALQETNRAIELLEQQDLGTHQYWQAILQRCDLYIHLERYLEAEKDFEHLQEATQKSIKHSREILEAKLKIRKFEDVNTALAPPAWKKRFSELRGTSEPLYKIELTEKEEQLIDVLSNGSKNLWEIVTAIYGNEADNNVEAYISRTKDVLKRIRKKIPNHISFTDGKYGIVDHDSFHSHHSKQQVGKK